MKTTNQNIRAARLLLAAIFSFVFAFSAAAMATGETTGPTIFALIMSAGSVALAKGFKNSERRAALFMACGEVGADIEAALDCDDDFNAGVEADIYIANRSDILSYAYDATNKMLLTNLVMKTGKQFYKIGGVKTSAKPKWESVPSAVKDKYRHTVACTGFSIAAAFMDQVRKLPDGNYVVLVANNQAAENGSQKWDLYGFGSGMKGQIARDPYNKDNGGAISITLASIDDALESKPPVRLYKTDAATNAALIETLTAPAA